MTFRQYIAVDWSGARGPGLKGLQVAVSAPGRAPPSVVKPPRKTWRRSDLADWIARLIQSAGPLLIGLDFAFAYPYCDGKRRAYFPGSARSPADPFALWKTVERICQRAWDFYGGPFYGNPQAPFADYLCYRKPIGPRYAGNRYRLTEKVCLDVHRVRPTCVFKCVGAESVGCGSVAGMRFLHHFAGGTQNDVAVWPFQPSSRRCVFVEIFPRLYYVQAGQDPRGWHQPTVCNRVLAHFHSDPIPPSFQVQTEDQADALVSAAAIRRSASRSECWQPPSMTTCAQRYEGWIFGV